MNLQYEATKQVAASIIRYFLVTLGSFLVTKGYVDPELADKFVGEWTGILVGTGIILVTVLWRYANVRYNINAFIKALLTDPPANTKQADTAIEVIKEEVKATTSFVASH